MTMGLEMKMEIEEMMREQERGVEGAREKVNWMFVHLVMCTEGRRSLKATRRDRMFIPWSMSTG
jgi:hypothetical protein